MHAPDSPTGFSSPAHAAQLLQGHGYLADQGLATAIYLARVLPQPLMLEGEAGVGKTEVAKALADALAVPLVRLQCYEGIDASQALYEWDYTRQLLHLRAADVREGSGRDIYSEEFLLERPLLRALRSEGRCVLLIDEIDRADDEFEAFLLEILSDFQISIPELGIIHSATPPMVILTSNRTRELHDALKRRCLYHWIDLPEPLREVEIIRTRAPEVTEALARKVVRAAARLRRADLVKTPGVAETISWSRALQRLGTSRLDVGMVRLTMGAALKERDDLETAEGFIEELADLE
ncbi:MAG: MoxR family ATPase [Acidimicrobiia bacterium]|nr:MoxR family ATPase [bacterium]MXY73776.1 MoxR family ATPase [Acidimicrobiia bacterium]MYA38513.1 MoxR family ATPase [Acidimicrobiia bacterium]MYG92679.1 MoxR family ATPase [Acidimicrobiia bacterium]MYH05639.1 MoxR family ATPase [Acidimicrobiia bacterium]